MESNGLTSSIIRFCEIAREKLQLDNYYLTINFKDYLSILEELLKPEII